MKVIKLDGKVINIGDWDYKLDDNGVETNPLPDGAIEVDEVVEETALGGRVAQSDYQTKRRIAYPSIAEQLDYIYHNGVERWKNEIIAPIKAANPKEV